MFNNENTNSKNSDRFIPLRSDNHKKLISIPKPTQKETQEYINNREIFRAAFGSYKENLQTLKFSSSHRSKSAAPLPSIVSYHARTFPKFPEKILDAPGLISDYSLNLIDWSSQNKILVSLSNSLYSWDALSGAVSNIYTTPSEENYISACKWLGSGNYSALGTASGSIIINDIQQGKKLRTIESHDKRVNIFEYIPSSNILVSGGADKRIVFNDLRERNSKVKEEIRHNNEVISLAYSEDKGKLVSGGNDCLCFVFDLKRDGAPEEINSHYSAVKNIKWCPYKKNVFFTGTGNGDCHLRGFDCNKLKCVSGYNFRKMIGGFEFNPYDYELVVSSGEKMMICDFKTLNPICELGEAHLGKILGIKQSPTDRNMVMSVGEDEKIKFWDVFEKKMRKSKRDLREFSLNDKSGIQNYRT